MMQGGQEHVECTWVEDNLSAYMDGELTRLARLQVRRHLKVCHHCREQVSGLMTVREQIRRVRSSIPREMFNLFIQFLLWTQPDGNQTGGQSLPDEAGSPALRQPRSGRTRHAGADVPHRGDVS